MNFHQNLKKVCDLKGTNITSVLDNLGLSKSHGTNWSKGSIPSLEIATKIANYLNISVDYLATGNEKFLTADEQLLLSDYEKLSSINKRRISEHIRTFLATQEEEATKTVAIPCSNNMVSAGTGEYLDDYEQWDTVNVIETRQSRKADFMLVIDGDSMEPEFDDGDYVLVRQQPAVDNGQIGIFYLRGKGYIKKFAGDRLISLNSKYPDIPIDSDDFKCFGLVLGVAEIFDE